MEKASKAKKSEAIAEGMLIQILGPAGASEGSDGYKGVALSPLPPYSFSEGMLVEGMEKASKAKKSEAIAEGTLIQILRAAGTSEGSDGYKGVSLSPLPPYSFSSSSLVGDKMEMSTGHDGGTGVFSAVEAGKVEEAEDEGEDDDDDDDEEAGFGGIEGPELQSKRWVHGRVEKPMVEILYTPISDGDARRCEGEVGERRRDGVKAIREAGSRSWWARCCTAGVCGYACAAGAEERRGGEGPGQ